MGNSLSVWRDSSETADGLLGCAVQLVSTSFLVVYRRRRGRELRWCFCTCVFPYPDATASKETSGHCLVTNNNHSGWAGVGIVSRRHNDDWFFSFLRRQKETASRRSRYLGFSLATPERKNRLGEVDIRVFLVMQQS